ncbi:MAG: class I SAM-dependent methyltransferase [Chloroflexi bacterium]|nr:class I SAM-dependent methyltransferase [Chloroflexota bacterium]
MARSAAKVSEAQPVWRTQIVACNLCGSTNSVELYPSTLDTELPLGELCACTSSAYGLCEAIVQCQNCGLVFQNPQPVPEDLHAAYEQVVDSLYDEEREGRIHTFGRSLKELELFAPKGRLLDIGSHLGFFVEVALKNGWRAEGIEPSAWASGTARNRGIPIRQGTIENFHCDVPYDAVTLWDVVEHLTDPAGTLDTICHLLKPGGLLALSTMDVEAPIARLMGRSWPWYMQMHLFYFSRQSLRLLVERAGFEVLEIRRHKRIVRFTYLVSRLERRLGRWYPMLNRLVDALGIGPRLVTVDLGDIVTLYARKPELRALASNGAHP